jgi:hypothetical protein
VPNVNRKKVYQLSENKNGVSIMAIPVNKLTKFRVSRGSVGNNRFSSFTYVGACTKEKCPAYSVCTYEKKGSCSAMRAYLVSAYGPMERLMRKAKDPGLFLTGSGSCFRHTLSLPSLRSRRCRSGIRYTRQARENLRASDL